MSPADLLRRRHPVPQGAEALALRLLLGGLEAQYAEASGAIGSIQWTILHGGNEGGALPVVGALLGMLEALEASREELLSHHERLALYYARGVRIDG